MAQITPGDKIAYNTPSLRYEGVVLLVAADRVVTTLSTVQTERVGGEEVKRLGPESATPAVLPVAAVEAIA